MGNEVAIQEHNQLASATIGEVMLNPSLLQQIGELANVMASSKVTVPAHLQGKPADCYAVVLQAVQWRMNPFVVAQKTHLVQGTLGYEAQLVNAVIQASGMIEGTFNYEYRGEGQALECRVGARLKGNKDITWGEWLKSSSVTVKNSPLWKTNEKQQLGYLQVKNWARLYCPGAILGVYTPDELQVMPVEREVGPSAGPAPAPSGATRTDSLKGRLMEDEEEISAPATMAPVADPEPEPEAQGSELDLIIAEIEGASTPDQLTEAIGHATMFVGPDGSQEDKNRLSMAYKKRIGELKAIADQNPRNQ